MYEVYPTAKGKEIEIEIYSKYDLTLNTKKIMNRLKEFLNENGYGFTCRRVDE